MASALEEDDADEFTFDFSVGFGDGSFGLLDSGLIVGDAEVEGWAAATALAGYADMVELREEFGGIAEEPLGGGSFFRSKWAVGGSCCGWLLASEDRCKRRESSRYVFHVLDFPYSAADQSSAIARSR